MKFAQYYKFLFPLIFVLSFFIFLAHTAFTKTAIFADGRFYYVITRSLVFDFDLNFANDYQSLGIKPLINTKGFAVNQYPPGTSFFWIPLFWIVDGSVKLLNLIPAVTLGADGFGFIYQSAVSLTSIFLGTAGLYLVYSLLRKYFSEKVALLGTLGFFSTTNLLFYIAVEPINSHAVSFFVSSLFVYYFLRHRRDRHYYFILGIIGGVAGLVRTQDALILVLPVIQIFNKHRNNLPKLITNLKPLTTGLVLAFLPQIILWQLSFRNFWENTYFEYGFNFLKPHIAHVLFNTDNGFLTTTPAILFAFIGLMLLRKKNKKIFSYALIYFLLQLYLVSSWKDYTQGGSYGIRMLIPTYPLLSYGFASVLNKSIGKIGEYKIFLLIILFSALNSVLIIRYLLAY